MKKTRWILSGVLLLLAAGTASALEVGAEYYVRTALHAVRGNEVYWVNYMAPNKTIPIRAGEKVRILDIGERTVQFEHRGKTYHFAVTHKGHTASDALYAKYFTKEDVNQKIAAYPKRIRDNIRMGRVERGMTKEQVLLAVGCPAMVDGQRTFNMTLEEILASDTWIFYYNRFNRWQVTFADGKVVSIGN